VNFAPTPTVAAVVTECQALVAELREQMTEIVKQRLWQEQ
jgi:hypothetical protein